jgi:uncharacterized protein YjbJ (UPF0337 family)
MNGQQVKGTFNQAAGRVQSASGALMGDSTGEVQGKVREARARLEGACDDAPGLTIRGARCEVLKKLRLVSLPLSSW